MCATNSLPSGCDLKAYFITKPFQLKMKLQNKKSEETTKTAREEELSKGGKKENKHLNSPSMHRTHKLFWPSRLALGVACWHNTCSLSQLCKKQGRQIWLKDSTSTIKVLLGQASFRSRTCKGKASSRESRSRQTCLYAARTVSGEAWRFCKMESECQSSTACRHISGPSSPRHEPSNTLTGP